MGIRKGGQAARHLNGWINRSLEARDFHMNNAYQRLPQIRALGMAFWLVLNGLCLSVTAQADTGEAPKLGPPITKDSLLGAGGVTLATWLISSTFQQVTGRSSKLVALVVAFGVAITVQFLTDAGPTGLVILLGVLNGCQAYLTAAGVATVSGAFASRESRAAGIVVARKRYGFLDSWY